MLDRLVSPTEKLRPSQRPKPRVLDLSSSQMKCKCWCGVGDRLMPPPSAVLVLCALAVAAAAEEVGQQPLNLDKTENAREKSYRQYVGQQVYVSEP